MDDYPMPDEDAACVSFLWSVLWSEATEISVNVAEQFALLIPCCGL